MSIDDDTRKQWREATEAATAGPWAVDQLSETSRWIRTQNPGRDGNGREANWPVCHLGANHPGEVQTRNAHFIAIAREAVPALLDENARLRTDLGTTYTDYKRMRADRDDALAQVERLRALLREVAPHPEDDANAMCFDT